MTGIDKDGQVRVQILRRFAEEALWVNSDPVGWDGLSGKPSHGHVRACRKSKPE